MAVNTLISVTKAASLTGAAFVDCRFDLADTEAGETAYQQSHIPGAQYAHLDRDLSSTVVPGKTGRHPLPEQAAFAATVRRFGIRPQQPVIAYDAGNGAHAARLWWLLRHVGHEAVWVLDGGFSAWQAAGLATEATQVALPESEFAVQTSLCKTVTAEELLQPSLPMLDARDEKRFRGEQEPIDPIAGHIPGALCLPFINNLTLQGHFKSRDELRAQIADLGFSTDQAIICYCGSGVTACHNILALRHAGFPEPYLYPGSWSEWITDPDRPIATV